MVKIINMTYIIANKLLFVGTPFGVWTGGFCVPGERVVLLACVVTDGHHSLATYQWVHEGIPMDEEEYPIIYVAKQGKFSCKLNSEVFDFVVKGLLLLNRDYNNPQILL